MRKCKTRYFKTFLDLLFRRTITYFYSMFVENGYTYTEIMPLWQRSPEGILDLVQVSANSEVFSVVFSLMTGIQYQHLIFTSHHTRDSKRPQSSESSLCIAITGTPVLPRCALSPWNTMFRAVKTSHFLPLIQRLNCGWSAYYVMLRFI